MAIKLSSRRLSRKLKVLSLIPRTERKKQRYTWVGQEREGEMREGGGKLKDGQVESDGSLVSPKAASGPW